MRELQHPGVAVLKMLRSGEIKKPERCQNCNKKRYLVAHHEDYFKPAEVVWVCQSCHRKRHMKIGHGKHFYEMCKIFNVKNPSPEKYNSINFLNCVDFNK